MKYFTYQKQNYNNYQLRIEKILKNEELINLGLKKDIITKTTYNYDIDYLTIGYGKKELFLVGGTHGSEIIGIDFLLTLIENIPYLQNFDPSQIKLNIIPLQNPEGYDISTNTLQNITESNFEKKSYEYYLRYRTDSIACHMIEELNSLTNNLKDIATPDFFLKQLKEFIQNNKHWIKLESEKAIPSLKTLSTLINNLPTPHNYQELKINLLKTLNQTLEATQNIKPLEKESLYLLIQQLQELITNNSIITNKRLYQTMFENVPIKNLFIKELEINTNNIYKKYNHPKGSQIGFDANGKGINLNKNTIYNPGINIMKNNIITYGNIPKNNIRNYCKGPIGSSAEDENNFTYEIENKILKQLIDTKIKNNNYLATLLYHGTGGLIYYHPHKEIMEKNTYEYFNNYNQELAYHYFQKTNYIPLDEANLTGFGDELRKTYPGVLLIELSKMGGNPIGPYGDQNNIYNTFKSNIEAIDNLLLHFKNKNKKKIK